MENTKSHFIEIESHEGKDLIIRSTASREETAGILAAALCRAENIDPSHERDISAFLKVLADEYRREDLEKGLALIDEYLEEVAEREKTQK